MLKFLYSVCDTADLLPPIVKCTRTTVLGLGDLLNSLEDSASKQLSYRSSFHVYIMV
jgi:hypothetical protein